ncbi:MAG: DUF4199 domain-containing protein [Rikenellaceae bacterium]
MENIINTIHTYDKKAYSMTILQGGLILALLLSLPGYFCWAADYPDQSMGGYFTFIQFSIYFIVMILMGKKAYKIYSPDGSLRFSYGKAYLHSFLTALVSGLAVGILTWLLYGVMAPDYYMSTVEFSLNDYAATVPNISDEEIEQVRSMAVMMTKPYILIPMTVFSAAFTGALVALISSLIVKKEVKTA